MTGWYIWMFRDYISLRFSVIGKKQLSISIDEVILETEFEVSLSWLASSPWKWFFSGICDDVLISNVKITSSGIVQMFQNGRDIDILVGFLSGACIGDCTDHQNSQLESPLLIYWLTLLSKHTCNAWYIMMITDSKLVIIKNPYSIYIAIKNGEF